MTRPQHASCPADERMCGESAPRCTFRASWRQPAAHEGAMAVFGRFGNGAGSCGSVRVGVLAANVGSLDISGALRGSRLAATILVDYGQKCPVRSDSRHALACPVSIAAAHVVGGRAGHRLGQRGQRVFRGQRAGRTQEESLRRVVATLTEAKFPLIESVLRQMSGLSGAEFVLLDRSDSLQASTLLLARRPGAIAGIRSTGGETNWRPVPQPCWADAAT